MTKRRIYAQDTSVSVGKSKADIEQLVKRNGATAFGIMDKDGLIQIFFAMNGRNILFRMQEPDTAQRIRARWRCLLLTIKSKIESAHAGIETFDEAFLAQTVMPNGQTVGEQTLPAIERHYAGEVDVPLLPSPRA